MSPADTVLSEYLKQQKPKEEEKEEEELSFYLSDRGDTVIKRAVHPGRNSAIVLQVVLTLWIPQMWKSELHN